MLSIGFKCSDTVFFHFYIYSWGWPRTLEDWKSEALKKWQETRWVGLSHMIYMYLDVNIQ